MKRKYLNVIQAVAIIFGILAFLALMGYMQRAESAPPTRITNVYNTTDITTVEKKDVVLTGTAAALASAGLKYRFKKSLQFGVGYGFAEGIHGFALGATGTTSGKMVSGSFVIEPDWINDQEQFVGGNIGVTW